jgi:signal transduction histidine kinase
MKETGMKVSLSTKATVTIICLVLAAVVGSSIALVSAWREKHAMDEMVSANVGDVITAAELDIAFLKQRGFVAAYIMDSGNAAWLKELNRLEPEFRQVLDRAESSTGTDEDRVLLARARDAFERYAQKRREVVSLYEGGNANAAIAVYLGELNQLTNDVVVACDDIIAVNQRDIEHALADERRQIRNLTAVMAASGGVVILLGLGLSWMLFSQMFIPLKRMARDVRALSGVGELYAGDELDALQYHMQALLEETARSRAGRQRMENGEGQLDRLAAIGNAVAFIAHEIRNRLATIGGFAHAIERRPDDPGRVKDEAGIIFQSSSRLEQMLAEVMEYSKPPRASRSTHSLNDLVRETVAPFVEGAPAGVSVEIELDPTAQPVIMDPGAVEQLIINLVRNSMEALAEGGRVKVSTRTASDGTLLVVADTGPGIPPEMRDKIFEPFFTTKKAGCGLGLSICRTIVSDHGAELSVSSGAGEGTTFTVLFRHTAGR